RLTDTDGYYHNVFTFTDGYEYLRRTMEEKGDLELNPEALKLQVSLYDCQYYMNGKPSKWTPERVKRQEKSYARESERLRRIHGRYAADEGRTYSGFTSDCITKGHMIPSSWFIYCGVDIGSGTSHPPAICFIGVRP